MLQLGYFFTLHALINLLQPFVIFHIPDMNLRTVKLGMSQFVDILVKSLFAYDNSSVNIACMINI